MTPPRLSLPREHLWAALIVLLALGLGTAVNKRLPAPAAIRQQPFVHEVSRGASANLRTGRVNVLGVTAAPSLQSDLNQLAIAPEKGIFVVLDVEYLTWKRPGLLAGFFIQSQDGRLFGGRPPVGATFCGAAQPGIPVRCQLIVEMARDALVGATALLSETPGVQGDDVAQIDLQIDEALARDLQSRKSAIKVKQAAQLQER